MVTVEAFHQSRWFSARPSRYVIDNQVHSPLITKSPLHRFVFQNTNSNKMVQMIMSSSTLTSIDPANRLKMVTQGKSATATYNTSPSTPRGMKSAGGNINDNTKKSNKPRLGEREGSRVLTKSELKQKELMAATKDPYVTRMEYPQGRTDLSEIYPGLKCRGRIISIKEFGFFVDIGSYKDGLVHVRDISRDYFIQNHATKFQPGQDLDVWVKFVDPVSGKLGLQCYPLSSEALAAARSKSQRVPIKQSITSLHSKDRVSGTVTKVSNYGVYLDIGAEVEAFLHRRKMRIPRKMWKLKPWEIHPVGSKVNAFVYEVTVKNAASKSDDDMSLSRDDGEVDDDEDDEDDEDEEDEAMEVMKNVMMNAMRASGASGRAMAQRSSSANSMFSATTGRVSVTTYDPADWDEKLPLKSSAENNMYDMDPEEMEMMRERNRAALERTLSLRLDKDDEDDDYDDEDGEGEDDYDDDEGEDLSQEEIARLREASPHKSNAKLLIDDHPSGPSSSFSERSTKSRGDVASNGQEIELSTDELFEELSGSRGYVTVKDVAVKWDFLSSLIQDGEIDESEIASLFKKVGAIEGKVVDHQFDRFVDLLVDHLGLEEVGGDFDNGFDGDEEGGEEDGDEGETFYDEMSVGNDRMRKNEVQVHANDDVSFTKTKAKTESKSKNAPPPVTILDDTSDVLSGFDESDIQKLLRSTKDDDNEDMDVTDEEVMVGFEGSTSILNLNADSMSPSFDSMNGNSPSSDSKNGLEFHYENRSKNMALLQYVFESVAGKKGYVEEADVMKWDFVQALIDLKTVDAAAVKKLFNKCVGTSKHARLFGNQFETFVTELSEFEQKEASKSINAGKGQTTMNMKANAAKDEAKTDEFDEGDEEDEEFESISIEEAFEELSGGKKTATFKAICEWDVVGELLDDGVISNEDMEKIFIQAGGKKNKSGSLSINYDGFEEFLDLLSPYAEDADDENELELEDMSVANSSNVSSATSMQAKEGKEGEGDEGDDEEDDDKLLAGVFKSLSGGKERCSVKDLLNWDMVLDLMGEGVIDEETLQNLMKECGGNAKGVDLKGFDVLVDKLVNLYEDVEDDEDEQVEEEEEEVENEKAKASTKSPKSSNASSPVSTPTPGKVPQFLEAITSGLGLSEDPDDYDEDEGDFLDVDTELAFKDLAKGAKSIEISQLKEWDVIKELIDEGFMTEDDLDGILETVGVSDDDGGIDVLDFEAILDEISMLNYDDEDEDEEEDEA